MKDLQKITNKFINDLNKLRLDKEAELNRAIESQDRVKFEILQDTIEEIEKQIEYQKSFLIDNHLEIEA